MGPSQKHGKISVLYLERCPRESGFGTALLNEVVSPARTSSLSFQRDSQRREMIAQCAKCEWKDNSRCRSLSVRHHPPLWEEETDSQQ